MLNVTQRQRLFGLFVVLLAGLSGACHSVGTAQARLDAQRRWDRMRGGVKLQLGQQQYGSGLFEDAISSLTEAIALNPTQKEAYLLLARANLELGKLSSADAAIGAAAAAGLEGHDLHYARGVIFEQRGRIEEALHEYERARALDENNVAYLVAEVECLVGLDRAKEAYERISANLDRFDDDGAVVALTAHLAQLLGDTPSATTGYARALAVAGENRLIAGELGRLLARRGHCRRAITILKPLVESSTDLTRDGALRRDLAACHLAEGNARKARDVLRDYASTHPDDMAAQLLVAKCAVATGDTLTALRTLDLLQQHNGHRPELWLVRAALRFQRGRHAAAAADLYDLLQNDPTDVEAHCLLAEVLNAMRRPDAARHQFERALELDAECDWAAVGLKSLRHVRRDPTPEPTPKLTSAVEPSPQDR
ncbi:MAG: tetratricopeptide repeat protein [Phycisphaerae bacterium]